MEQIIMTRGLTKTYKSPGGATVRALNGVTLSIPPGQFVAVMGPSGCGKSTLLHLLGGLDSPTAGEAYLGSTRLDTLSEARRAKLRRREIGFVFQFFNLIGNLSIADNVELPALLAGRSASEARRRRIELLSELGISDKANSAPANLSGGQQQRVALARALVNRPAVLLADEPTGNLDTTSTRDVLTLLRQYNEAGQTILLVTHDARVASIADRIITMRDGQIADETHLGQNVDSRTVLSQLIQLEV